MVRAEEGLVALRLQLGSHKLLVPPVLGLVARRLQFSVSTPLNATSGLYRCASIAATAASCALSKIRRAAAAGSDASAAARVCESSSALAC